MSLLSFTFLFQLPQLTTASQQRPGDLFLIFFKPNRFFQDLIFKYFYAWVHEKDNITSAFQL